MSVIFSPRSIQIISLITCECQLHNVDCQLSLSVSSSIYLAWQKDDLQYTRKLWSVHFVFCFGLFLNNLLNYVHWLCSDFSHYTCLHAFSILSIFSISCISNGKMAIYIFPIMDILWTSGWVLVDSDSSANLLPTFTYKHSLKSMPYMLPHSPAWEGWFLELYFRHNLIQALCDSIAVFSQIHLFWNSIMDLWEFTVIPGLKGRAENLAGVWAPRILHSRYKGNQPWSCTGWYGI